MSETAPTHETTAPWIYVSDLPRHPGERVEVRGWLQQRRKGGKILFLVVRDGTGAVQCVGSGGDLPGETFEALKSLPQESSLIVTGVVKEDPRSPGGVELSLDGARVVALAEEYPITPKEHGVDFLMDHRHLWLRSSRQHAILRVRGALISALRGYLDERGFLLVDAPIFTPNACEGTTTLFETQYFEEKAYLTQSGQLYMEAAAMAHGKVYCFGPTFRAEKSKTRRHLIEFWMLEPEIAYATVDDVMALAEDMLVEVVGRVLAERKSELLALERDLAPLERMQKPFPRLHYTDAVERVNAGGVEMAWGKDFV